MNTAQPQFQGNQQPKFTSYVRLQGDNDVYGVNGLLKFTFDQDLAAVVDSVKLNPPVFDANDSLNVEKPLEVIQE